MSSPPGGSARGIVRLSGPSAFELVEQPFRPLSGSRRTLNTAVRVSGKLVFGIYAIPAFACYFPQPRSYTRQDMVELHLVGAPTLLGMMVERLLELGARRAEPGEFTTRAFLAGAMDASQVHGVAGLIAARSDRQLRAAEQLLHGSLSQTAHRARETLADLLSLVEGAMDFADEPIEFITPTQLVTRLIEVRDQLGATLSASVRTERWARLPTVALIGPPNAGKSSLFNRLTGMDRAICTPIAGTTRDAISAPMSLGESECLLIDTAGIDDAADSLDAAVQAATSLKQRHADVVIILFDATNDGSNAAVQTASIRVANKCDLIAPNDRARRVAALSERLGDTPLLISARTGEGCDSLRTRISGVLAHSDADARDVGVALMAEHREALDRAAEALDRSIGLATCAGNELDNADLVAIELRAAAAALGVLAGRDDTEALLGRIFARFCVGK
ncbi:MAG: 50S ribosome-binding GTPase [Planctomycetes bacterium]|nr:50S ribosome-binding GTPase [Planctomycetota bacterium]